MSPSIKLIGARQISFKH